MSHSISPEFFQRSRNALLEFHCLKQTDPSFKKSINALISDKESHPFGVLVTDPRLKDSLFVTKDGSIYALFADKVIDKGHTKVWCSAVSSTLGKERAYYLLHERYPSIDPCSPLEVEHKISTSPFSYLKILGFYTRPLPSLDPLQSSALTCSLQKRYDCNLSQFVQLNRKIAGLRPAGNYLSYLMLRYVQIVHEMEHIHGDIKLSNFLVDIRHIEKHDANGNFQAPHAIVLGDFGHTRRPGFSPTLRGTPMYLAPEAIRARLWKTPIPVDKKTDAWAVGISILKLRIAWKLFPPPPDSSFLTSRTMSKEGILSSIRSLPSSWISTDEPSDLYGRILWRLLRTNPDERWTVEDAYTYHNSVIPKTN